MAVCVCVCVCVCHCTQVFKQGVTANWIPAQVMQMSPQGIVVMYGPGQMETITPAMANTHVRYQGAMPR